MSMAEVEVLITGAAGRIGSAIRPAILHRFGTVRLVDSSPISGPRPGEEVVRADIRSLSEMIAVVGGARRIVHLAAIPDEDAWERIRDINIDGTFNVFEAARIAGAQRVVYASSHHIVAFTEAGQLVPITTEMRPTGLYGVSKAFGEALAKTYSMKFGLSVICLRIAAFCPEPSNYRELLLWISPGDTARLISSALQAPDTVRFLTAFGVSGNTRNPYDKSGWSLLGYVPEDNSESFVGSGSDLTGLPTQPSDAYHGGSLCLPNETKPRLSGRRGSLR